MPKTLMTQKMGDGLVKTMLIFFLVNLVLIGYVFTQANSGQARLVEAQQKGCEITKRGNKDAAVLAQSILDAFYDIDDITSGGNTKPQDNAEVEIRQAIEDLIVLSGIDCNMLYPKVGFFS